MTTQEMIDITNMTDTEIANFLNGNLDTQKIECRIDYHHGYYNLVVDLNHGKSYHKTRKICKSPVSFLQATLPEMGYKLISIDRSEKHDSLTTRGCDVYYTTTVKKAN